MVREPLETEVEWSVMETAPRFTSVVASSQGKLAPTILL
jgi:hypothetical protein